MIAINDLICNGCGICLESCPFGVLIIRNNKAVVINPEACHNCHACIQICPNRAIKYVEYNTDMAISEKKK
jgi:NAD-dependent dihydropyrimidine dehydrogenase PreA subunit